MTASLTLRSHSAISERRSSRNQFVRPPAVFGRCLLKRSCPTTPPSARYAASPSVVRSEACLARQNYPCHRRWRDGRDHAAIRQVENWWCGDAALNLSARSSLDRARHLNRRSRSMRDAASAALPLSLNPPTRRQCPRASTAVNSAMPCARLANRQMPRIIGASK
jgi:hypothetical protein